MSKGIAFSGNLEFLSLGELLQIIGNNGGTGVLRIMSKYAQDPGLIYLDSGDPVDASSGEQTGLDALYSLFGWIEGEFFFNLETVNKKNVINKNRMEIILDGSRMVDDGKTEKLGPVSFKKDSKGVSGKDRSLPLIKGPFIDYMYVVDEEEFYEGDEIVIEGNYGNWIWVILEGVVEVSRETPKGPLKLLRLSDGSYIGSIASFLAEGSVRSATAIALERVQLGMLDSQRLSNEYTALSPELRVIIKSMDNRLKKVTDSVTHIYSDNSKIDEFMKDKKAIIEQGKKEERIFTITKGTASIVRKTESGHVPLLQLGKGDFFGHLPFLKMGHEPHAASVFASNDFKVAPLDADSLQKEHASLSSSFRNIMENVVTCISVSTMLACEYHKKINKKSKQSLTPK